MIRPNLAIAALVIIVATTAPTSAQRVSITRIDGTATACQWQSADDQTLTVDDNGTRTAIPLDDLQQIRFNNRSTLPPADFVTTIYPAAGGQMLGVIKNSANVAVIADTTLGDDVTVPFDKLAAVWFDRNRVHPGARAQFDLLQKDRLPGKDILVAIRDDNPTTIKGGILELNAEGGRLIFNSKERTFNTATVPAVIFAVGLTHQPASPITVSLTDGTIMPGRLISANTENLTFETAIGPTVTVPLYRVAAVRFASPRVVYLTDLAPADIKTDALLLEPVAPRFDRSAANTPLTLDDQTYEKGIGTHAKSEIRYTLDHPYDAFAALIGIDDVVKPRGHVTYRVLGDGRTLYESDSITGADRARPITVDIKGVRELTLVTDFGEHLDISDFANWADARLIKPKDPTP